MRISNLGAVLLGIIFLAMSVFITAVLFGWTGPIQNLLQDIGGNIIYSSLSALGFLLLAVFTFSLIRFGAREEVAIVTTTKHGQLRIAEQTIADIVTRSGLSVEGVKELRPKVHPHPDGMNIHIRVVINPEFVIPSVAEEVQVLVKEDVEKYTGLKVAEVKVMVQSIDPAGAIRAR